MVGFAGGEIEKVRSSPFLQYFLQRRIQLKLSSTARTEPCAPQEHLNRWHLLGSVHFSGARKSQTSMAGSIRVRT